LPEYFSLGSAAGTGGGWRCVYTELASVAARQPLSSFGDIAGFVRHLLSKENHIYLIKCVSFINLLRNTKEHARFFILETESDAL
jgi:hypothetical protein